jgi:hypothetical protein
MNKIDRAIDALRAAIAEAIAEERAFADDARQKLEAITATLGLGVKPKRGRKAKE